MKKILIFILLTVFAFGAFEAPSTYAFFRVEEETKETVYVEGIRHTKIVGSINNDGKITRQVMNYLGANVGVDSNLKIVVGDNYYNHQDENGKWGMFNIHGLIENVHSRYDHFEVLAGVNGDFYDINNTGRPVSAHIRNFEVVQRGDTTTRPLVGFKDNGEVVFGLPQFEGYELLVFNDEGQLKNKLDVAHINSNPLNDSEISVYFDNYLSALPAELEKVYIDGIDTKITESNGNYYGKGVFASETTEDEGIGDNQFVIVGKNFNQDNLITETDTVVVQVGVTGTFDGVRFALGSDRQPLVIGGAVNAGLNAGASWNFPAPRTAVGVKADGTVFFVVVDGRNKPMGMEGVTLPELAEIMFYFGAVDAFNLDGGGSSTMTLKDIESGEYMILNTPSDGRLRSISNGIFIVKGEHERVPDPIPSWPDTRDQLTEPTNIYVDQNNVLRFNEVEGSISYSVLINGVETIIQDNELLLDLEVGIHEISVRAKGGVDYKSSDYTTSFLYQTYPNDINLLIDMIKDYTQSSIND
ncbi:MAG: phosphodiester glycosidase family protein [Acholeplasmataceae bacterium]